MHPSNNLILPILRKHGDRLLKAQIEAMVKDLSWEEQEAFLKRQLDASVEEIREKLAQSYPNYPFLTEWESETLRTSVKAWVFALSGEQNYLVGIDDFSITLTLFELGKPMQLTAYTANTQAEIRIGEGKDVVRNGYRMKPRSQQDNFEYLIRLTGNEIEEEILAFREITRKQNLDQQSLASSILGRFNLKR